MAGERFPPDLQAIVKPIDYAIEDPENAKIHPTESIEGLRSSLRRFGQVKPIIIWRRPDGKYVIKAGNGTYRAAVVEGWRLLAMAEFRGTETDAIGYALADNRLPELSKWDVDRANAQSKAVGLDWLPSPVEWAPAPALERPPIEVVDAEFIPPPKMGGDDPQPVERTEAPDPIRHAQAVACRVVPGDVWLAGDHQIVCGDLRKITTARLLCGQHRILIRHTLLPGDYSERWWVDSSRGPRVPPDWSGYWYGWEPLRQALKGEIDRAGWSYEHVNQIARVPDSSVWFEPVSDWDMLPARAYLAMATVGQASEVFVHPYEALREVHSRMLAARNVDPDWSKPLLSEALNTSEIVLENTDALTGTLLAAHLTDRRCFGIHSDPVVCSCALSTWESLTGQMAEKA